MPFDGKSLWILHALLDDNAISFNIKRRRDTISPFPRNIIADLSSSLRETIVPGLSCSKEKALLAELKSVQNWKKVKEHTFDFKRELYSLLWRFSGKMSVEKDQLRSPVPLDPRNAKKVRSAMKKCKAALQSRLRPGRVFLFPDREITFNSPGRITQMYARRVLVFAVPANQVLIIPFSSKIERMNKATDILFDSANHGKRLVPDGKPAVENFPYHKLVTKKTALFVNAAQSFSREDFLAAALTHMGAVRMDLLNFVKERMKNIPV